MLIDELFHYTKASTAIESILFQQKLKLSQLQYTNDPREFKYLYIDSFTGRILNESVWIFDNKILPVLEKVKLKEWKVLCLSQHHPDLISGKASAIDNPLLLGNCQSNMWAHYASTTDRSHNGVCLMLNRNKLEAQIKTTFGDEGKYVIHHSMMQYNNKKLFNLIPFNLDQLLGLDEVKMIEVAREFFNKNYYDIFFLKSEDWIGEHEYRWIVHSEKNDAEYIPINDVLVDVLVGENFPEAYYPSLEFLCGKLNIVPRIIYWENGIPGIKPIKCNK